MKAIPETVEVLKVTNMELYPISYATIVPVLTKVILEQQAQIEMQKQEIAALKAGCALPARGQISFTHSLRSRFKEMQKMMGISRKTARTDISSK